MPNVFDTIDQPSSQPKTSGKRNIFDDIEQEPSNNIATGTGRGLVRGAVQFGKGIVGAIPPVAAFDIGAWINAPKVLTDEAEEKYKDQPFHKPFQPELGETKKLNVTSSGLIEMATGVGHPENTFEKAALWAGYLKSPKAPAEFTRAGIDLMSRPDRWKEIAKSFAPTGKEASSAIGAGLFMQAAEDGQWGPMGQLAAGIVGSMVGHAAPGIGKGVGKFAAHPIVSTKEAAARMTAAAARFGNPEKLRLQQELIRTFREAGIQADLGSITGSNLMKTIQARLASSGLVGKRFDEFKELTLNQLKKQVEELATGISEGKARTAYELDRSIPEILSRAEGSESRTFRDLYAKADDLAQEGIVSAFSINKFINDLEAKLTPGGVKSAEQQAVLKALQEMKNDIAQGERGDVARVRDLINTKRGLQDKINYEVKGGAKQLLKGGVKVVDDAIMSFAKQNPKFGKAWREANSKFGRHVATYRNREIAALMKGENSSSAMAKMSTPQGIRRLERALTKTKEGQELFNEMKRAKFEDIVMKNMIDGVSNQFKLGKFTNLLEKGKNRDLIKEILGPQNFSRLERLQKSTGALAESAQKFFNSSKSGTTVIDAAIGAKALTDLVNLFMGNPWPFMKTAGGFAALRLLSKAITDPVFLRTVEEGMLAAKSNKTSRMRDYFSYATRPFQYAEEYNTKSQMPPASIEEQAFQNFSRKAENISDKVGPQPFGERRSDLTEGVTQTAPDLNFQEFGATPSYMQEPKRLMSEYPEQTLYVAPILKENPTALKTHKNSWNKLFNQDSYETFYEKGWEELSLGDLFKLEKDRIKFKDVLDVPVERMNMELGATLSYSKSGSKISVPHFINPSDLYKLLHHEGEHALQYFRGELKPDFINKISHWEGEWRIPENWPKPETDYEKYLQKPAEVMARKSEYEGAKELYEMPQRLIKTKKTGRNRF